MHNGIVVIAMSKATSLRISSDTLERFDWYRDIFKMNSDDLLNHLMDKLGLATVEVIRQDKKAFPSRIKSIAVTESQEVT